MADASAPPATESPSSQPSQSDNPTSQTSQTDSASASASASASFTPAPPQQQSSTPVAPIPNPNPSPVLLPPPPPPTASYGPPPISGATFSILPGVPSFRPVPQFSSIRNYQNPGVPPPGVSSAPSMVAGSVPAPMMPYQVPPGQAMNPAMRAYAPIPNGYVATPQGTMTPAGLARYSSPYPAMVRPSFPLRPLGAVGMLPGVARPHVPGIPGVRPIITPIVRPVVPSVTPAEKPQTTVYVGKIAPTVDNDFMLSLLRLCGPVKSWKRAPDPTDGTPRGFGFCEFESADGVLRALRLLSKFNIDGQELVLNVNQGTREYLKRYVEKKTENAKKLKEGQAAEDGKEVDSASGVEKNEVLKSSVEDLEEENAESKGNNNVSNFAIVTDEDREGDQDALEKLTNMIEERLKTKPLPPPPAQIPTDSSGHANPEFLSKLREGDTDVYVTKNDAVDDRNDDETTSDNKATSEHDKPETSSPERSRRYDRRNRDRDRERDVKRDKEREIERYERDAERERVRKEREQRRKIEEAEREYVERLKDWEYREREREKQRQSEKEKEKDRERKRKKEILYDEEDEDDDSRKRWRRSALEDKRRRRQREKEDDLADRLKEEEEIAESEKRAEEEQQQQLQRDALKLLSGRVMNGIEKKIKVEETSSGGENKAIEQDYQDGGNLQLPGDGALQNGTSDDSATVSNAESEIWQSGNAPARKLGFGLVGSGKRTAVPSVFHEEDDDAAHKDKKMRPLVPIDYSTDELQAVQPSVSGAQPVNLAAAAEFAKHISHVASKEEKPDAEKERSRRSRQRDRDRNDEDNSRTRDEDKGKTYDRERHREAKTPDTKKLLDAKQLIDMIPKTKEELFSYEINWAVYDKHELHERMRPWISKKITEFLGEEETTLVDYIVSSTQEHVKASQMLELLQSILDEEAEMFVLKMWRMLIFEIKKVETGISAKSRR